MFKVLLFAVAITVVAAQYHEEHKESYGGHKEQYGGHKEEVVVDYYTEPHYHFAYEVEDKHTGDIKSHKEQRKGHHTEGVYMLVEPDGSKRVVEYVVEGKTGFNAKVQREKSTHPQEYKSHSSEGHGYSSSHDYKHVEESYKPKTEAYHSISYKPQESYKSEHGYKSETYHSKPEYKSDSHYSKPSHGGHATSSISFSLKHDAPKKYGYESKY